MGTENRMGYERGVFGCKYQKLVHTGAKVQELRGQRPGKEDKTRG